MESSFFPNDKHHSTSQSLPRPILPLHRASALSRPVITVHPSFSFWPHFWFKLLLYSLRGFTLLIIISDISHGSFKSVAAAGVARLVLFLLLCTSRRKNSHAKEREAHLTGSNLQAKAEPDSGSGTEIADKLTQHQKRYGSGEPFWFSSIKRQGFAAYQTNSSYVIYRNVRDYGAKG